MDSLDIIEQNLAVSHVHDSFLIPDEPRYTQKKTPPLLPLMTYHQLFYTKTENVYVLNLSNDKNFTIRHFETLKETHEAGIKKFKSQNISEQFDTRKRKRTMSIDYLPEGSYNLNNWLSKEDYPCEKSSADRPIILLYQLLALRFNKANEILIQMPQTATTTTLRFVINNFKVIMQLLEEDKQLQEIFLQRTTHEIKMKSSSESISLSGPYLDLLDQTSNSNNIHRQFSEISSLPKKIECIKSNLDFVIKFCGLLHTQNQSNPYIVLAVKFLSNTLDQSLTVTDKSKDYSKLLLSLDLRLPDRLNFANKLLIDKKKRQFTMELQDYLCNFPHLENILFYDLNSSKNKDKQLSIHKICQSYLDQTSDLQTLAYLAYDYIFLKKYYFMFKQVLELSFQSKQIERLQNYKKINEKDKSKHHLSQRHHHKDNSFFSVVNTVDEKIGDWKSIRQNIKICQICCKKIERNQSYFQCGKCLHGGHINHLLKWFSQYQNCCKVQCPCLCN